MDAFHGRALGTAYDKRLLLRYIFMTRSSDWTTGPWKDIPSWAVIGTGDHIISPSSLRAMAQHAGARITEIDASHVSMVSHPPTVVEVIEEALQEVGLLQPA